MAAPDTFSPVSSAFRRHWIASVLFLVPVCFYLASALVIHIPELYQHLLLTISAVMGIHLLDRLFLLKDTQEALENLTDNIRTDISSQTKSLLSTSGSLEAMDKCGIVQIYPSRVDAAGDMKSDITATGNRQLLLMGISLNDFMQGYDEVLLEAWKSVQSIIRGESRIDVPDSEFHVRILLIDPLANGAVLRSKSESEKTAVVATRLQTDVQAAAEDLLKLQNECQKSATRVKFECRLYRLPPMLFLVWVDSVCYVQQYHFWSSRNNRTPIPVLKYRRLPASASTYPYHDEMSHHFRWIWENASVSVCDYVKGFEVGADDGVHGTGTRNIYRDPAKAAERMAYLLTNAKKKVTLLGVSLNSFFRPGPLRKALSQILEDGSAELEILLLDPDSEQALYRSHRERLFVAPERTFREYIEKGEHAESELYQDTKRTISNIAHLLRDVGRTKDDWSPRIKIGLYKTAPACFILRVDDCLLVEQYHYGKVSAPQIRALLGKDMPLVEYNAAVSKVYESVSNSLRYPFSLLVNHLDYVASQATILELWRESARSGPGDQSAKGEDTEKAKGTATGNERDFSSRQAEPSEDTGGPAEPLAGDR